MKIKLHSVTDLITNSSTTIYTFSEKSEVAFKALVDEFFKTLGINKTCDDVFSVKLAPGSWDAWSDYASFDLDNEEINNWAKKLRYGEFGEYMEKVWSGQIDEPQWVKDAKSKKWLFESGGSSLMVIAKSPEYEKLATLFTEFLYSTESRKCEW